MDSKAPLLPQTTAEAAMPRRPTPKRFSRFSAIAVAFVVGMFWLGSTWQCTDPTHHHGYVGEEQTKVPLEIHIMSKCSDAQKCLQEFVVPAMANVSDKVDFRLSFIGTKTDEDDGVQCKHGQTECLGNILELCAASEYPDPKIYLGFTMCLTNDYKNIPKRDLVQDCALEHGIDFDTLNNCMSKDDGAYGMGLLRDSVQRSHDLNVTKSCTVRLDDKVRCITDDGEYKNCDGGHQPADLIRDINKLYKEAKGWTE